MRNTFIRFEPLVKWPKEVPQTPNTKRRRAPFKAQWMATTDDFRRELGMIKARDPVIYVDCEMREMNRLTGMPRADARTRSPGVILTFTHPQFGELRYVCDTYTDWQGNVRAIALTLEALRAVERYGAVKRGEQYAGSRAIPATTDGRPSVDQAAKRIADYLGWGDVAMTMKTSSAFARDAARQALARAHPDKGGKVEDFQPLSVAAEVLEEHHRDAKS